MALTPGTKLGPYEIQSPLGAGGMGEVYRATDTKLGRDIALKVLPAEMAQDPERLGRFRREAKALAQLDHPNIVTIHSVEECGGIHFLTMQLVDGLPLDRLIPQGGLPVEQIIEIASALGDALAAAHEKGIVHRDLKPANVMVSNEGRVKVLDFGLAKDVRGSNLGDATMTSASRTEVGVVMGTPAYMSPEQTSARPLDHRTDIFSLGVMLHEMATGRRPFEGTSSAELVSSILRDTPPSVTDVRPDLPSDLARIVRRCLEKDPRHRLQTARDVSNEFRDLARQTSQKLSPPRRSTTRALAVPDSGSARADEGFWVAVLPFKYSGGNAELTALVEGLTEDIVTGLSRFSYLRVIARNSTTRYANESFDVRSAGKELGARYVMEGSLRQAGTKLRLAVQLVDAATGAHLWAENYERAFSPESVFELQDDLVPRIVSTVADMNGVLSRSMSEDLRSRTPEQLSPYEAVLRSFGYLERVTPEDLAASRSGLELAVRKAPAYADAWAMLAFLCVQEYGQGFNLQPDSLASGLTAARRAVEVGPSNHLAYCSLAQALFFQKEFQGFRNAAERTIAINPMDGNSIAFLGELLTYAGNWERGLALSGRAKQLNPNHPGWYWYADFYNSYRQGDYRAALSFALKFNLPNHWGAHMGMAIVHGQLGERDAAAKALRELLQLRPDFAATFRKDAEKWWEPEYVEQVMDGLRKAGLEIADESKSASTQIVAVGSHSSGATRADEGFWVAVLPFKYAGASAELKALADGLSEEVVTGLSRFSYLRVIARGSTAKYSSESGDIRAIGKELGARYVMEGSLRQAGTKLRLAVQLVDAVSGAQMWAETYERAFNAEAIFEVQDELVLRIVSTVADQHGVLPHSMANLIRNKPDDQLSPYEAVLRVFSFHERMSPEEHATVRALLERTVQSAPSDGDCWAMLATLYSDEYMFGFSGRPDSLGRARAAAQQAIELAPSSSLAYQALAQSLFFRREWQAFRPVAERTITLNRADGALHAFIGMLIALTGDWDRGCAVVDAAIHLNPHHPGWYWLASVFSTYHKRDYRASADIALRVNMPGYFWGPATSAAAFGQLGERERAQKALKELLIIRPDFARTARQEFGKWFDDELTEHYVEGLRKAGLQIVDSAQASAAMRASGSGAARADEGFWVAVLPFRGESGDAVLESLADGLTEDVTTGLSRFPYLQVIAHNSAMAYKGRAADIRTVGRELGARYVIEGSIRKRGRAIRVSAQLMDAASGTQLWAEAYDREIVDRQSSDAGTFQVQDGLTDHIVTTVADGYGVLVRSMAAPTRDRKVEELSASELVLRHYAFMQQISPQEHAVLRAGLERALEREPNHANAWACLSNLYQLEYFDRFNPREKPLERAREAAWRAVKIDPACQTGWKELASVHFFSRDFTAFRETAERAMSLNPRDGTTLAWMAIMIAFSGDWERGVALTQRAIELNRHHPGWYHNVAFHHHYRKGEYEAALQAAKRINMPEFHWMHLATAASCGMLGRHEEARTAIESLRRYNPTFLDLANVREDVGLWDPDKDEVERLLQGLQKAGLKYGSADSAATADSIATKIETKLKSDPAAAAISASIVTTTASGASRANEGFWVAVLPFKYSGNNADLAALAEGLSEDIVTGLSRFSYLRVIARGSTLRYANQAVDIRAAAKELGARYVMEGSLRQAGATLRVAVQLVDATTGAHLWAENYERTFTPDNIFALQDDLVPRIVSTVADYYGILPHTISDALRRQKNDDQLSPYEAVLRAFSYFERITPEEHAEVRQILERAAQSAPGQGEIWAMLSTMYWHEHAFGFNPQPDPLGRALAAARRSVDVAPTNNLGHSALAVTLFYQKNFLAFRPAAERAIELNRMDGSNLATMGTLTAYSGDWEHGCALVDSALRLNPHHPGWYWFAHYFNAYRKGDYRGALSIALKFNMPGFFISHALTAAVYGQLGMHEPAQNELQELLAIRRDFAVEARQEFEKSYAPELVQHLIDGLRKAGLEVPDLEAPDKDAPFPARSSKD